MIRSYKDAATVQFKPARIWKFRARSAARSVTSSTADITLPSCFGEEALRNPRPRHEHDEMCDEKEGTVGGLNFPVWAEIIQTALI